MSVNTVVNGRDIRTVVPEGKDTLRTRIIQRLMDIAVDAPFDEDEPDGAKLFDTVKKGTLEDIAMRETPGLALEEGAEQLDESIYRVTDKRLRLFFNVKPIRAQGIDPDALVNYYFARIAKLFVTVTTHLEDIDGEEIALDISEAGNSIQTNGSSDPEPGGTIYLDVDYRHARGDLWKQ